MHAKALGQTQTEREREREKGSKREGDRGQVRAFVWRQSSPVDFKFRPRCTRQFSRAFHLIMQHALNFSFIVHCFCLCGMCGNSYLPMCVCVCGHVVSCVCSQLTKSSKCRVDFGKAEGLGKA